MVVERSGDHREERRSRPRRSCWLIFGGPRNIVFFG